MLRPLALLTIIALLILLGWWFADQISAPPAPAADQNRTASADPAQTDVGEAPPAANSGRSIAPGSGGEDPTDTAPAGEPTFTVQGRTILADGSTPLEGCSIQLRREPNRGDPKQPWQDVATATQTAADGTFTLGIHHDDWTDTVAVRIHKDGYVPRTARWQCPKVGTAVELGDIAMLRAISVAGTVVDEAGVAVEDASMMFVYIRLSGKEPTESESMLRTRSDAAGRFWFDLPAHSGEWYVGVEDTGALLAPRSVKLTDESSYDLRVVVERPDPAFNITGTITDPSGRPIPGMRLSATGEGFIGRGRSNDQGRFVVQRAGPINDDGKAGTALSVRDPDTRYERVSPAAATRIPWGKDGVQIVMRERASQSIRVIDDAGRPVTSYTLFAFRGKSAMGLLKSKTQRGNHPDGRCRLVGLQGGPHAVVVVPRASAFGSTEAIPFEVVPLANSPELVVTVKRAIPTTIKVVSAAGLGIEGSTIEVLQGFGTTPPTATTAAPALRNCDQPRAPPGHVVIATATTDATDTATMPVPPGSWHVRATGKSHLPLVQATIIAAPTTHLQLAVQPAAMLTGRVEPADALARLRELGGGNDPVAVIIEPEGGKALPPVPVAEDGTFTIGGLRDGLHHVSLRYWLRTGSVRADNVTLAVTDATLQAANRSQLTIDAAALLPGTVTGRIVVGGQPLADVHCFLRRNGPGKFLNLRIATDQDGRFTGLVPAGDYGFSMTYPAQPGPGWLNIVLPEEWQLAPDQTHTIDFDVPLRRIRLRVVDADRAPRKDLRVRVVRKGYFLPGGLKTDDNGEVEVFPAPLDAFHVEVTIADTKQKLGPFDLPQGETTGTIVVQTK